MAENVGGKTVGGPPDYNKAGCFLHGLRKRSGRRLSVFDKLRKKALVGYNKVVVQGWQESGQGVPNEVPRG